MKEVFKVGKVANMLAVTPKTVRNYIAEDAYAPFLSPESRRIGVAQSTFFYNDILVLNTIRILRRDGLSVEETAEKLKEGFLDKKLPLQAAFVESYSAAEVYQIKKERDELADKVEHLLEELTNIQKKHNDEIREINKQHMQDQKQLMMEMMKDQQDTQRLVGKLQAQLEEARYRLAELEEIDSDQS